MSKEVLQLSVLNPVLVKDIPEPIEVQAKGKEYMRWGQGNDYPDYLLALTEDVATLGAIINNTVDFVAGDEMQLNVQLPGLPEGVVNKDGETIESFVKKLCLDKLTYGGFCFLVARTLDGSQAAELYYRDFGKMRSDKEGDYVYYSPTWGYNTKAYKWPTSLKDDEAWYCCYNKGDMTRTVYPKPFYYSAIKAAECEKAIDTYHLSNINNNFSSNAIVNLNNGKPDDEQKREIEKAFQEKFSGAENAGRVIICYNDSTENATTIEKLADDSSDEKYQALAKRCKEVLFTTAGMNPIVLGIQPENNGFSKIEYAEAFKLYNKTRVLPLQKEIVRSIEKVLGEGCLTIKPYVYESAIDKSE